MGATPFLVFLGTIALTVGTTSLQALGFRKGKARWPRIAQELGLTLTDRGLSGPILTGRLRGFSVSIAPSRGSAKHISIRKPLRVIRIIVDGIGKIAPDLELRAEGRLASLTSRIAEEDVLIHDPPFDAAVHIQASERQALAVMSYATRQTVLDLLKQGSASVSDSKVVFESDASWEDADIQGLAHLAVNLTERLALPVKATAYALAANALTDPVPEVRKRNLDCLFASLSSWGHSSLFGDFAHAHPQKEEMAQAARAALADVDPRLRLLGAMLVGDEAGFAVLKELVENGAIPAELRARATLALASQFQWERVEPIVAIALTSGSAPLQEAAVLSVGAVRAVRLTERVCALAPAASMPLQIAIATTLGELGNPKAEPTLLELLGHSSDEVRIAAAQALGQAGTIRAVEPLLLVKNKLLRDVKTTARQAARAIQGRLGNVEAGCLSVVEHQDGQGALSLASEGGRLSLADQALGANGAQELDSKKR